MKKRVFCFVFAFFLVFSLSFLYPHQEAKAALPVLAAASLPALAAVLISAGLTFSSIDDMKNTASVFYSNTTDDIRSAIDSMKTYLNGIPIARVSLDVWSAVRSWIRSKFSVGQNTNVPIQSSVFSDGISVFPLSSSVDSGETWSHVSISTYDSTRNIEYVKIGNYTFYVDNIGKFGIRDLNYNFISNVPFPDPYRGGSTYYPNYAYNVSNWYDNVDFYVSLNTLGKVSLCIAAKNSPYMFRYIVVSDLTSIWNGYTIIPDVSRTYTNQGVSVSAKAESVLTDSTYDVINIQTRDIVIPDTADSLVGKTYIDVNTATPDTYYTPQWPYEKWTIPQLITQKFPFSIPWDLKNAILALQATPEVPKWHVVLPSTVFVGGGELDIDFSQFESLAKITRWGVLILFNVYLILATRKIIGAGG